MSMHPHGRSIFTFMIILSCVHLSVGSHFRGGTISWKPTGNGNEVKFNAKTGWVYAFCTPAAINNYTTSRPVSWICASGCPSATTVNSNRTGSICTGGNADQNWEKLENVFTYTFPSQGPFQVEYTGGAWIGDVGGGSWRIATTIDLRQRSDTGKPNHSPVVSSKPIYNIKFGCTGDIVLPLLDEDRDNVWCRWAVGNECVAVCHNNSAALVATLDPKTCTVTINANDKKNQTYAIAIMFEDRPASTITLGTQIYTPNQVISTVPMQFLVKTPDIPSRSCSDKPAFVDPTPRPDGVLVVKSGDTLYLSIYALSRNALISSFSLLDPPPNVHQSAIRNDDLFRLGVFATDLIWTPTASDLGLHTLCVEATDSFIISSQMCLTIKAWDKDPCEDTPCWYNGTCTRDEYTDDFVCTCAAGYTGVLCETEIDECNSNPCQNSATCFDLVNSYFCGCPDGFTGKECETDINECVDTPCENGGTCTDLVGTSECDCVPGTYGNICQNGFDPCADMPCHNGGQCNYSATVGFTCTCIDGWQGKYCTYKYENNSIDGMTNEHMIYSDCNCKFGNYRQEKCSKYRLGKDVGFGFLGLALGIVSAILLYLLYEGLLNQQLPCFHEVSDEHKHGKISNNQVEPEDPEVENLDDDKFGGVPNVQHQPEESHVYRHRKCYACNDNHNYDFSKPIWLR